MEQSLSTSKVTVEYFDPHDIYKLLAPGLIPRLPLRNLHWQSHAGPLRSIETLHVELIDALAAAKAPRQRAVSAAQPPRQRAVSSARLPGPGGSGNGGGDDGFQTQPLGGGNRAAGELEDALPPRPYTASTRRHQIPGLRQTPYLKVLLVRCDDNDQYKSKVRSEVRDWIKEHATPPSSHSNKKDAHAAAENHDAYEWLIIHVVVPNTVAATQPRATSGGSGKGADGSSDSLPITKSTGSLWSKTTTPLLEKLRSDFTGASKGNVDRITQIRIGVNDVPYDILPRVVPAVPTGYSETEDDAKAAWAELIDRFKRLILSSFDLRVTQYEEDIKEKDAQRSLPGWNFCTFFILKEGLAMGFESVGLVEDALVGYDELSVGLDSIIQEQAAIDFADTHGGSLLPFTPDLRKVAQKAMSTASTGMLEFEDEETVDLQVKEQEHGEKFDDIPISVMKKPYRDLILANNVSIFDFRCYIFARQITLLLRLGNAWSTREELLHKLREQQESVLHGVAPRAPPPTQTDESENLSMLAEICKRTLEFIPAVSQVMRRDLIAALMDQRKLEAGGVTPTLSTPYDNLVAEVAENVVASFAFSIAQQILAQTSTKGLPVPSTTTSPTTGEVSEPQSRESISERPAMFPTRTSSLMISTLGNSRLPALPSPNFFPGPGDRRASMPDMQDTINQQQHKAGQEELAARRAELYALSRNILEECGKKRGWSDGWSSAPEIGETGLLDMDDVNLDDDAPSAGSGSVENTLAKTNTEYTLAGVDNKLLRTALDNREDFYRLYEMLTDKALRHYTVANHTHSVLAAMSDLAVMKYYLEDYAAAASYFLRTTPFYGESGWSLLELSMLVMYSRCLRELRKNDDYVRVVLKLLSKAANSEKEKIQEKSRLKLVPKEDTEYAESEAFKGFLPDFLAAAKSFNKEVKHSLLNFFTDIELEGTPIYEDGRDSFCLRLKLRSVLADPLPIDKAMMRIVAAGGSREMWLEQTDNLELMPGRNKVQLRCNAMSPGMYEVDRVQLHSGPLRLSFERQAFQPFDHNAVNFRNPYVVLYQRAETLDLQVEPAAVVQLDQNSAMDLELTTGWNEVQTCEIRIRSATGGLRLLTAEAKILDSKQQQQQQPVSQEPGLFSFSTMAAGSSVKIRIPFTTEQEVPSVSVKVEVKFTTDKGTFTLSKTPSISLALKLGVNVQDVFKHTALFSRFTVSSASQSPLRLFKSELVESDTFESRFGVPPANPVVIFPKQPASLLYQIRRKPGSKIGPNTQKTMYLNLSYSVLQDEITDNIRESLTATLKDANLWQYSRLVIASVLDQVRTDLTPYDLERAAMLGVLPTGFLAEVRWQKQFYGLGTTAKGEDVTTLLSEFVLSWTRKKVKIPAMREVKPSQQQSIVIPVDVPSIPVVHTADIRLQRPIPSLVQPADDYEAPVVCVNQLLSATLHLKWTRVWDTGKLDTAPVASAGGPSVEEAGGDEFTYEVTAPGDTWLVGGRKKGHFVIPAALPSSTEAELSSSPVNEADIPLILIPLREGYLPYPSVEVREAAVEGEGGGRRSPGVVGAVGAVGHCETDYRNLGETVRVVADRGRVTVSLDASGLGGGPLVLESERVLGRELGRIVA